MAVWPPTLPKCPVNRSYVWAPASNTVETPNDVGDVISRRRFTGVTITESGTLLLTREQTFILYDFWSISCAQGAIEFIMASWRDEVLRNYRFASDGPPQFVAFSTQFTCALQLRYTIVG
jgi:hypothetical protein